MNRHSYPEPVALALSGQGWSLIPVYGDIDPTRPKAAAVAWEQYQQRRAHDHEITGWLRAGHQIAIVTGRVSGLVAIDFDDMTLAETFRREHSELARRMLWVTTRRGVHGYLRVNTTGDRIASMKAPGVDFKADGGYVVALFSVIAGHEYNPDDRLSVLNAIARGQQLLSPVSGGLKELQEFMHARAATAEPLPVPDMPADADRLSVAALISVYLSWHERGRNNALYHAAALMHDHFYPVETALGELLTTFINTGPYEPGREREGRNTIYSAYKRQRQPVRKMQFRQTPNCLRQAANRNGDSAAIRVLDSLRAAGIGPGATINQKLAYQTAHDAGIGGHSVRQFFAWLSAATPPKPPTQAKALRQATPEHTSINAFIEGVQNRQKIKKGKRGRPEYLYTLPDNAQVAARYGVKLYKAADSFEKADFKSIADYRAAQHREFVKRRPGQHAAAFLMLRLGKSRQTLSRYNVRAGIKVQASYNDVMLKWSNLSLIPNWRYVDTYTNARGKTYATGVFLDIEGKRYPALADIAAKHLKEGRRVVLKFQTFNTYWHKSQPEHAPELPRQRPTPHEFKQLAMPETLPVKAEKLLKDSPGNAPRVLKRIRYTPEQRPSIPAHNRRMYRRALTEHKESLASAIHKSIPEISMPTARRMVHLCGAEEMYRALAVVRLRQPNNMAAYFAVMIGFHSKVRQQKELAAKRKAYRDELRDKQNGR